jgi:hypothetical protein
MAQYHHQLLVNRSRRRALESRKFEQRGEARGDEREGPKGCCEDESLPAECDANISVSR